MELKRHFSKEERERLAASGAAMPGGRYPIENEEDLRNALSLVHHSKDQAAVRAHIAKRAAALGLKVPGHQAKDADGDGMVDDGKPTERPAPRRSRRGYVNRGYRNRYGHAPGE